MVNNIIFIKRIIGYVKIYQKSLKNIPLKDPNDQYDYSRYNIIDNNKKNYKKNIYIKFKILNDFCQVSKLWEETIINYMDETWANITKDISKYDETYNNKCIYPHYNIHNFLKKCIDEYPKIVIPILYNSQKMINIYPYSEYNDSLLEVVVNNNDENMTETLIIYDIKKNEDHPLNLDISYNNINSMMYIVLNKLLVKKFNKVIKILLNLFRDNENKKDYFDYLRIFSVYYENKEIVQFLIDNNFDINLNDKNGLIPLTIATICGYDEIVKILLQCKDIELNKKDRGMTALMYAVKYNNETIMNLLLENNADINILSDEGNNLLFYASINDNNKIFEQLLPKFNVNHQNDLGNTTLITATNNSNKIKMQKLLEYGADVNIRNNKEFSALDIAVLLGDIELVNILLKFGANINKTDNNGKTILMKLLKKYSNSKKNIINHLISIGGKVNDENNDLSFIKNETLREEYLEILKVK
jgi:ankyrin repeat protein